MPNDDNTMKLRNKSLKSNRLHELGWPDRTSQTRTCKQRKRGLQMQEVACASFGVSSREVNDPKRSHTSA